MKTVSDPMKTVSDPMKSDPMKTVSDPMKSDPMKTVSDPMKSDPMKTVSDPMKTVSDPMKTVSDPMKTCPVNVYNKPQMENRYDFIFMCTCGCDQHFYISKQFANQSKQHPVPRFNGHLGARIRGLRVVFFTRTGVISCAVWRVTYLTTILTYGASFKGMVRKTRIGIFFNISYITHAGTQRCLPWA